MQVNLSTNLPNPAGEANARCAGISNADASGGFFFQMGQILNQHETNDGIRQGETPSATDSKSGGGGSPEPESDATAHSRQSPNAGRCECHGLPDAGSDRARAVDEAGSCTPDAQSAAYVAGIPGDVAPLAGFEPALVQNSEGEDADDGIMASASDNPHFVITPDPSAYAGEILQSQNTGSTDQRMMNESAAAGAAEDATIAGSYSEKPMPVANSQAVYSRRGSPDRLIENIGQQPWNVDPETPTPMVNAGTETASGKTQREQAQNAQLNVDNLVAANSEMPQEAQGPSLMNYGIRMRSSAGGVELSEAPASGNTVSRDAIPKKSPGTVRLSTESPDASGAFADRHQMEFSVPGEAMRNKSEPRQIDPGWPHSAAVERKSPLQPTPASSPWFSGESAAAANAPPAHSSASHAAEVVFQLADQIRMQVRDGRGEICIRLKPDSLGRLEIRAENTVNGVSARISTESNAVKSYLDNNLQVLQQALQDQGLRIDRIHIIFQDASDSQSSPGFSAQFGHTGSEQHGREAQFSSGKAGPSILNSVDEAVLDAASWLALYPNNRFYTVA